MPRTIEGIVESHRLATALRNAGKPIWTYSANIREIIQAVGEETPESVSAAAVAIAARLRAGLPARFFDITHDDCDFDFLEAVEDLEDYSADRLRDQEAAGFDPTELFNERLDSIYDWADRERAWLG